MFFKKWTAIALCQVALTTGSAVQATSASRQRQVSTPKNVILFIGDGMGFESVKAAGMYANGIPGTLSFEGFPQKARVTTRSADSAITDSAAAATAIATGTKVNNDVISTAIPGDGRELKTLLEYFKEQGKSTGLVTTVEMTHATPAAFGAHEPSRTNTVEIARDYLTQTRPEVLFGGGGAGMTPTAATAAGYKVVGDRVQLLAVNTETETRVCGQFGTTHLPYEYDGVGALPHLSEMTQKALAILDNDPDGFFLMVEGGKIDHANHQNQIERSVRETVEFSRAVQEAQKWAEEHPETLILVTADHETGGLKVENNNGKGNFPTVSWATNDHTSADVPVYAWGVNSDRLTGVIDNTNFWAISTGGADSSGEKNRP